MNKFYITTTLPYVNAPPHIGFALEMAQADAIARYQKLLGKEVFFNTGTDEHGIKIYQKALESDKEIQAYVNEYAEKFKKLMPVLGISDDIHFIRTTDEYHVKACREFWKRVDKNGFIEKKNYKVKYCVGCELEKTDQELDHDKCPIHPNMELEIREEENYFFKFSKLQKQLLSLYKKYPDFVVPDFRFNEIKKFVGNGLQDFSISRLREKMPWGVPVPGDEDHVMYVWFDALINYISTLGWGNQQSAISNQQFEEFWGTKANPKALQIAGKDNLRQQSAMWQAMLLAAGLPTSRQIIIHGFINSGGQKMSKSLGNVADPYAIIHQLEEKGLSNEQATDALRYYLLGEISTFEDGDYTFEHLVEVYNGKLANGLGNLTSRILKMAASNSIKYQVLSIKYKENENLKQYELQKAMQEIWKEMGELDEYIQKNEPFKTIKTDREKGEADIRYLLEQLHHIAVKLQPFLPQTSEKILQVINEPKLENIPKLFPRIEA
ncbi:MAG: methionine--tRNA ligase [Candidatus Doudnabacteria bacterium CG10_big_fil_rev_8_21_14_0_10_42_18]|uniref:Methionine--tRNA ligase n=1 Tax=Candidatus Doudnabacteria bacterium CG10_big_fil_rev_8_21_14_0_10_42_18 TaxID=1974552 RepID=A0A2H0VC99_9BACT|nr:MAG: methionine--tRNA ligase [Candidatus Doudnabacteria bacterium CG10_big_fil_rev_8_21_14_0_10_42_18]